MKKEEHRSTIFVFETTDGQELRVQRVTPTVEGVPVESEIAFHTKDGGCEAFACISLDEAKELIQVLTGLIEDTAEPQTAFKSIIN